MWQAGGSSSLPVVVSRSDEMLSSNARVFRHTNKSYLTQFALWQVGYAVGSRGLPLPDVCLNALDDGLIPLTHEASTSLQAEDDPVVFELIFSVLDVRPSWKVASKQY